MNAIFLAALSLGVCGLLLLLVAVPTRAKRGLGSGETVALDNVTLYSERLKLVGRPDRIVKRGDVYIPEEWKSAQRVGDGHRLQIGTYFILIEEEYGVRPPFGVIVLGDGSRVEVPNTAELRAAVMSIAQKIAQHSARLREPIPVRQPSAKCRRCGQRTNCNQATS